MDWVPDESDGLHASILSETRRRSNPRRSANAFFRRPVYPQAKRPFLFSEDAYLGSRSFVLWVLGLLQSVNALALS